ncbi:ABC transporter ATP-binding protein [Enterococcus sp. CSURQ0835]|uniref:ABC transporter ATP-binding protein n=1 Tax=Enterococcus sp. CSURQ0835 TaxID=2681394 RepID=UPI001358D64B|nr:ABC transporter ATP-binding protein [Enterococcus sp. CSURQ0835]
MRKFSSLKRLMHYINPYKKTFYLVLFFAIVTLILGTLVPYLTGLPTTEVAKNVQQGEAINFAYVFKWLVVVVIVGIIYCGTQLATGWLMANVVQNAMRDLREAIETKINRLPVSYFDKNQQGNILSRVTNDVDAVSNALQQAIVKSVNAVLGIFFAILMMFYINPLMAVISMIMIPTSLLISRKIVQVSQKDFQQMQNSLGELNGYVQENMTGFGVLKLYGREKETLAGFKKVNHELRHSGFRAAFVSSTMQPLVQLTAYATYIAMAVLGSWNVIHGVILVGQLQAFIQYIWQVSQPMGDITQLSSMIQSASASAKRVFEILDEAEEVEVKSAAVMKTPVAGNVAFENVSFSYDPKKPLIKNLSFSVKAGETVAVVGPTGAGKTTLINLLMRFYDVDEGKILIDGVDTQAMKRSDVRALFGMVLQDAWLYEGTIADNIRFGRLEATDYEVVDAAKTANVDHFIRTMPGGYEMEINAEGDNVSLGQKQLLTIARAVISDPKILILDEATSSVDTRLESLIQKAMDKVMEGRTSFVIAHRLSTIREADLILVMKEGQIIEHGTHEELLQQQGFYEKLYNSQFAEETIE